MQSLFIDAFTFLLAHETFTEADEEGISDFSALGVNAILSKETMALLEKFVCQLYLARMVYGQRAEMVVVSIEASAVRLKLLLFRVILSTVCKVSFPNLVSMHTLLG